MFRVLIRYKNHLTHMHKLRNDRFLSFLFGYFFSDSSMLGERDRIRNAVGWELDDTATSSNNNGVQQSGWVSGIGNVGDGTENNNSVGAAARSYSEHFCEFFLYILNIYPR